MPLPIVDCQLPGVRHEDRSALASRGSIRPSAIGHRQSGFTLIEMLTTVAVLIIVLGLMVSLARNVRNQSAQQLTNQLLRQLAALMNEYADANAWQLPPVTAVIPAESVFPPEEPTIDLLAKRNNEEFVRVLRPALARLEQRRGPAGAPSGSGAAAKADATTGAATGAGAAAAAAAAAAASATAARGASFMGQLPTSVYDGVTLRDAWGSPIVFMPAQHPWIGMAPRARDEKSAFFFFSAGPDRRYLSRDDNLYSYETVAGEP